MLNYFIDQKHFFDKLDYTKYKNLKYNLCGLINIFIILKNIGFSISETEILEKSIKLNAYNNAYGWKYAELIKLLKSYGLNSNIFKIRFFHNYFLEKKLRKLKENNLVFMASIKYNKDENHLILIDDFNNNSIYYKSVGTQNTTPTEHGIINYHKFLRIYNKRGIIINLTNKK